MAVEERDPHTGYLTTGHEWNGIKELNTPVPRPIYYFLGAAVAFAIGYWILMPAWPTGASYTKGLLGVDQRATVARSLELAALDRSVWTKRVEAESFADIAQDPGLMETVRETGRTLFNDNCAACHGRHARGGNGFPSLATSSWLWGGSPEVIAETIRVGINSAHPESRSSQMPAFGRDGVLPRAEIEKVVAYVRSLSDPAPRQQTPELVEAGKEVFETNCAACHGDDATGNPEMGAPNLADKVWIYGGDAASVYASIWRGRQGHMPTWDERLSPVDRKVLALYLLQLRAPDQ